MALLSAANTASAAPMDTPSLVNKNHLFHAPIEHGWWLKAMARNEIKSRHSLNRIPGIKQTPDIPSANQPPNKGMDLR